jgi:hypothetical protein
VAREPVFHLRMVRDQSTINAGDSSWDAAGRARFDIPS